MKQALFAALFIGVMTACGDPTGSMPGRFDARYAAGTLGETPLPVTAKISTSERTLLADTISFNADGTALRTTVTRLKQLFEPFRVFEFSLKYPYTYEIDGIELTLTPTCGPAESCTEPVSGEISDSELRLPSSLLGLDYGRLFMDRIR